MDSPETKHVPLLPLRPIGPYSLADDRLFQRIQHPLNIISGYLEGSCGGLDCHPVAALYCKSVHPGLTAAQILD